MNNIFAFKNFRDFLRNCFELRANITPGYSLRQFARYLGISHSRLSEILSSESSISLRLAATIADALELKPHEKQFFLDLVASECGRTEIRRSEARNRIEEHLGNRAFKVGAPEDGGVLSKWYYLGMVELLTKIPPTPEDEIKTVLKLSDAEFNEAKAYLLKYGFITATPVGHRKLYPFLKFETPVPSSVVRGFHLNMLNRASRAILEQQIAERKYLSSFIGLRKETLPEARRELEQFNESFLKKYASEKAADAVYCFSMQLFRLDQEKT